MKISRHCFLVDPKIGIILFLSQVLHFNLNFQKISLLFLIMNAGEMLVDAVINFRIVIYWHLGHLCGLPFWPCQRQRDMSQSHDCLKNW